MKSGGVHEAVVALRDGGVVLVPTETVVGLVASEAGLGRVQEIKGRDPGKPIALLCASGEEAFARGEDVPPLAEKLAELYWPGPLTLVLKRAGGGTIGLRVPDHPTVRELLAAYGGPLYATSANLSGAPAPRSLEEVDPRVRAAVDVIVGGVPGGGVASAVVDLTGQDARLLRPGGGLTDERLARLAGEQER
ncbi:MAG: L-threonylcarbamoyladenylate synthase [Actinomycetota bacterium]|nr:L-threonylcarbamoyladenylate synthase [Actinomycetota bacterium]